MAKKENIQKRRDIISNFVVTHLNNPPTFTDISNFVTSHEEFRDISDPTIRRDLKELKIICNRMNRTYYHKSIKKIYTLERTINLLLKKFTLYKPISLNSQLSSLNISEDNNPSLELFAVVITTTNKSSYTINDLISRISKLYKINSSLKIGNLYIYKDINIVKYVFSDLNNLSNFYENLIRIQSNNYPKK